MSATHVFPRLQVVVAALLFSTGGVAIKSCALTSWQIASFRCGVAAVVMWLILPQARRRWDRRVVLVGLAYAATLTFYALANKATTAANSIFLQSTAPLYILLLAPVLLGERTRRRDLFLMVGMAAGMALFFVGHEAPTETAPDPARGNLLGALAGFSWALTVMGLRWIGRSGDSGSHASVAVVAGNVFAFLIGLPMALPVAAVAPSDWLLVVYLGVFQISIAYVLLTHAVRVVSAFEVALLLLIDPVVTPLWAWWVHGEVPGAWSSAGGAIVVLVTAVKTWLDASRR
ncbi:MAG: EamA family transporter [bacterium]|nr:EamA family transporter [bacterium]